MGIYGEKSTYSLRKPEATSIARHTAFNRHTIKEFFGKLEGLILSTGTSSVFIYNLDEKGCHTVQPKRS